MQTKRVFAVLGGVEDMGVAEKPRVQRKLWFRIGRSVKEDEECEFRLRRGRLWRIWIREGKW
jgi:hypothetical protein